MADRNNWSYMPFGDLTENFDGLRIPVKKADREHGPYPYYGASGIVDWVDNYIFEGEYLLIAEDGENLKSKKLPIAFMANGKFWVNNHAHIVKGNSKADTRFLMYAFREADVNAYLSGSTMPKLTQGNLNRIPIYTPPLPEQKAIAAILGALDDKIELNRKMNETLEAMARAIFKSWFVDFDPIPGLSPHKEWQDSPLGRIPKGWRVGKISEIAFISRDGLNPSEYPDEVFDHYSIPAFDEGRVPKAETGQEIKSNKYIVPSQAVLLAKLNPRIPRVWLPDVIHSRHSVCSTEFLVIIPQVDTTREYLYGLFSSDSFMDVFATLVAGTSGSHQRVKPEYLFAMDVVIPNKQGMIAFTDTVKHLFDQVVRNLEQSLTLASIRDALLPKLLSGEIRVKDAEEG